MVDFNLNSGNPVITKDIDLVMQQIDILFDTHKNEVFGQDDFGTDFERLLYDLQLSNSSMEYAVQSALNQLDLRGYQSEVKVYFFEGSQKDIALIEIGLFKEGEVYKKTYSIS